MDIDEHELANSNSSPIDMLEHWFGAHGWSHERVGDEEIVASCDGSWPNSCADILCLGLL